MATIPVLAFNNLASTTTASTWTPQQAQRNSILDRTNPNFPRVIILDNSGVIVQRPNVEPNQLPIAVLLAAVAASNPALTWAPICTVQPVNVIQTSGGCTFSATFTAETAITYQWQNSTNAGFTWANCNNNASFSGVTTSTLTVSNVALLGNHTFRLIATNASGSTNSNVASLTVPSDPAISQQPVAQSVSAPFGANFSVTAVGATSFTYQWQYALPNTSTFINLTNAGVYSGVTTPTLTISNSTGLNLYAYRVICTDAAGSITSGFANLIVN